MQLITTAHKPKTLDEISFQGVEVNPINFKEANVVFAKNQKEYLSLPTHKTEDGVVTSCWKFSILERIKVLFCGKVYLLTMTFNKPIQPQKLQTKLNVR